MDVEGEEDVVSLPPSFGSDDEFDQDLVSLPSSCEFDSDPSVPDDHDDEAPGPAAQAIRSNSQKKTRKKFGGPVNTALDHSVPDPAAARRIADSHDCLELYSPPRVLPMAAKLVGAKGIFDTQSCGVSLLSCSPVARFRCCFYRLPAQYFPLCKICGIRRDARQKNGNRDGSKAAFLWITAAKQPRFRYEEKGASCTNTRPLRHRGLQWPALPSCAELLAYRRSFLINVC